MQESWPDLENDSFARENLRSVITRLIQVVRQDLDALNKLVSKSDPWTSRRQKNIQEEKRTRCKEMIDELQDALKAEDERELELISTEERLGNDIKKRNLVERYETADRIMKLLLQRKLVNGSEVANYLQRTLKVSNKSNHRPRKREPKLANKQFKCKGINDIQKRYKSVRNISLSNAI